ncbi:MAG: hypothetical protein AAGF23_02655 [Acidobacteriota bacterium]
MFFSRTNVIVALVLFLTAQPALAQSPQRSTTDWLEPVRQLWSVVTFYMDLLAEEPAGQGAPGPTSEASLGWIDPSGAEGDAPGGGLSGSFSDEAVDDSDSGASRHHGWIDPSGLSGSDEQSR